mmetsp:Transcript_18299/g.51802  ORF Transcript_18299/g.51802 Transcript_18299/m.51802 type:complete len:203 (-) Transcript_18299:12-620(-)
MVLLDLPECDLGPLRVVVGQEHREKGLVEVVALDEPPHQVELGPLGCGVQPQAQHPVEPEGAEGAGALVGRGDERELLAHAADADPVLQASAPDLASAEVDHHLVVRGGGAGAAGDPIAADLSRGRGGRRREAPVGLAGVAVAIVGGDQEVAAPRVEHHSEGLCGCADVQLPEVGGLVGRPSPALAPGVATRVRGSPLQRHR